LQPKTNKEFAAQIDYLEKFLQCCKQEPENAKKVMQFLKDLYEQGPEKLLYYKFELGRLIVRSYNAMGLSTESDTFFSQKYLPIFQNGTAFDKIEQLTSYADDTPDSSGNSLSQVQSTVMLQAAEQLLPQCTSYEYQLSLRRIADRYLTLDRQKSVSLLESFETSQAKTRLITCGVYAAVIGTAYFYPLATPVIAIACYLVPVMTKNHSLN
jgi:hypothetical protein